MPPETSKGSGENIGLIGNWRRGLLCMEADMSKNGWPGRDSAPTSCVRPILADSRRTASLGGKDCK